MGQNKKISRPSETSKAASIMSACPRGSSRPWHRSKFIHGQATNIQHYLQSVSSTERIGSQFSVL